MRLLRTTSADPELIYIANELEIPRYAILSHVWGAEEVTFQDMQDPLKRKDMKGWSKVVGACKLARSEDWQYIWMDTCCIDKLSSSELSEAINSMYKYYSKAEVCYAYLEDMQSDCRSFDLNFRMCKWFTRGWTLQELIAPKTVFFFTNNWEKIGTKASLRETITQITGIPLDVLLGVGLLSDPRDSSIAARMSWAAGRETTRVEDRAYSLMGIFGVYMPSIYGEGEHAFIRLQEEILKVSNDHTIFAWKSKSPSTSEILATSPDVFEKSGRYLPFRSDNQRPFSVTNIGLLVHLPLLPILPVIKDKPQFLALLNCRSKTAGSRRLAIRVKKSEGGQYERIQSDELLDEDEILVKCGKIEESPQELLFRAWDLSRSETNYFHPDRMAVFISGGQGIMFIRVTSPRADLPVAIKSTDPADQSIGVFAVDHRLPQAFLFIHEPTRQPFVVVAGHGWLDLLLELETEFKLSNLIRIQRSYGHGKNHADVSMNLDRMSKFLTDNVAVLVEIRRQFPSGLDNDACYVLNVRIVDKIYLDVAPAVLPIHIYAFSVSFSSAINAGFSLLTTYPKNAWEEWKDDAMNLFLDNASITGTLCFQHGQNRKRFAVTLGFCDETVWSDVQFLVDTVDEETAKDNCGSYHSDRIQSKVNGDVLDASDKVTLRPQDSSLAGKWVLIASVHSHELRKSHNQYKSEIKVTRYWERSK